METSRKEGASLNVPCDLAMATHKEDGPLLQQRFLTQGPCLRCQAKAAKLHLQAPSCCEGTFPRLYAHRTSAALQLHVA